MANVSEQITLTAPNALQWKRAVNSWKEDPDAHGNLRELSSRPGLKGVERSWPPGGAREEWSVVGPASKH